MQKPWEAPKGVNHGRLALTKKIKNALDWLLSRESRAEQSTSGYKVLPLKWNRHESFAIAPHLKTHYIYSDFPAAMIQWEWGGG